MNMGSLQVIHHGRFPNHTIYSEGNTGSLDYIGRLDSVPRKRAKKY